MNASTPVTKTATVLLAGNPNSGKTTLFNALTGSSARVGNYPGVTVERRTGRLSLPAREVDGRRRPGHLQPHGALAGRAGRDRRAPRAERASGRPRGGRRRREHARPRPLPRDADSRDAAARRRRAQHDGRGEGGRARDRRRRARACARRGGRARRRVASRRPRRAA